MSQFSSFRDTGMPTPPLKKFNLNGSVTTVLAAPGEGKRIVITDVLTKGGWSTIKEGGNTICHVPEGHTAFASPLALSENTNLVIGIYGTTGAWDTTVLYFID